MARRDRKSACCRYQIEGIGIAFVAVLAGQEAGTQLAVHPQTTVTTGHEVINGFGAITAINATGDGCI